MAMIWRDCCASFRKHTIACWSQSRDGGRIRIGIYHAMPALIITWLNRLSSDKFWKLSNREPCLWPQYSDALTDNAHIPCALALGWLTDLPHKINHASVKC